MWRPKHKGCEELGICSEIIRMPQSTTQEELLAKLDLLNKNLRVHGILVQLPLPGHLALETAEILNFIHPDKDVDGFHPVNVGRLGGGEERLVPCTPYGCIKMLEMADIPVAGKRPWCWDAAMSSVNRCFICFWPVTPQSRYAIPKRKIGGDLPHGRYSGGRHRSSPVCHC